MTPRALADSTLIRFILVGGSMSLLYSMLTAVLTGWLPLPAALVAIGVWVLCMPPAFWLQSRITFARAKPRPYAPLLYAATQASGLAIVATAGALFATRQVWADIALYIAASVVAAVFSYFANALFIFAAGSDG